MKKYKIRKSIPLAVMRCNSFSTNFTMEYKKKYSNWNNHNSAIYINDYRVKGPKDYNKSVIYDTNLCGCGNIDTVVILKALSFPDELIDKILNEVELVD